MKELRKFRIKWNCGMFAIVNQVIQAAYLAKKENIDLYIEWNKSLYKEESKNTWEDFFKQPIEIKKEFLENKEYYQVSRDNIFTNNNIIAPKYNLISNLRLSNYSEQMILLPPSKREKCKEIIKENIKIKNRILKKFEKEKKGYFKNKYVIGVHARGEGRIHGGMSAISKYFNLKLPPFNLYFTKIDEILKNQKDAYIFLATDSKKVQREFKEKYGKKLISRKDSITEEKGEMHENNENKKYSPYKLGEDVIIEALMLSETNIFVHGNSSISNFILGYNPNLQNIDIFSDLYKKIFNLKGERERKKLERIILSLKKRKNKKNTLKRKLKKIYNRLLGGQ